MYSDFFNGVYFVEGIPARVHVIRKISRRLASQLKTLDDVKELMALDVQAAGGNAVVDFKYRQTSSFWRSLISLDNVYWESSGFIATIDPSVLDG